MMHSDLKPAEWWVQTCCGVSHHCSPSYITTVCGHYNDFSRISFTLFYLVSWFLSWIFLYVSLLFPFVSFCFYCVCLFPLLHLCAGCKTAVELRWEVRELQKHQGEQVIYVCVYVFILVCSTAQWFDITLPRLTKWVYHMKCQIFYFYGKPLCSLNCNPF